MFSAKKREDVFRTDHQGIAQFDSIEKLHEAIRKFSTDGLKDTPESKFPFFRNTPQVIREFTEKVIKDMGNLEKEYSKQWEYDGPGAFHKASITATRMDNGTFTLEIDTLEEEHHEIALAKEMGVPIGYNYCNIKKQCKVLPGNDCFQIPMTNIVSIYKLFNIEIDEQKAFVALTTKIPDPKDREESKLPTINLFSDAQLEVSLCLKEDMLREPARITNGAIHVRIQAKNVPCFDLTVEKRIRALGDSIEAIWNGNAPKQENTEVHQSGPSCLTPK